MKPISKSALEGTHSAFPFSRLKHGENALSAIPQERIINIECNDLRKPDTQGTVRTVRFLASGKWIKAKKLHCSTCGKLATYAEICAEGAHSHAPCMKRMFHRKASCPAVNSKAKEGRYPS
jgi:hypothetical protein